MHLVMLRKFDDHSLSDTLLSFDGIVSRIHFSKGAFRQRFFDLKSVFQNVTFKLHNNLYVSLLGHEFFKY